jgi:hypothetical protein
MVELRTVVNRPAFTGDGVGPRVSVVVPTYNEAANLPHVFAKMPPVHEVIVVDGRSSDGTIEVARELRPDVRIVQQNRRGKGNAMACGFAAVTGDVVVMLDADGSADPGEIELFVAALVGGADFAKGSRFMPGGGSNDITTLRRAGNLFLNVIANVLFRTRYSDLCYGYNAFWADCLRHLELEAGEEVADVKRWGDGFEIETLINTRVAKANLRIEEVPSFEHPRLHGVTNLNTFRDGFRVLWALAVERVNGKGRPGRVIELPADAPAEVSVDTELTVARLESELATVSAPTTTTSVPSRRPSGRRRYVARHSARGPVQVPAQKGPAPQEGPLLEDTQHSATDDATGKPWGSVDISTERRVDLALD